MRKDMSDFISAVKALHWKGLFAEPTGNPVTQFFRYSFVGGLSFAVDAGFLWLSTRAGLHYLTAAAFAFAVGIACNYLLSKLLVFRAEQARGGHTAEIIGYALIGLTGLALTEVLMYLFTGLLSIHFMVSKAIGAVIVLLWNFLARKHLLYKG
jgi:putative flippase GtrA